MVEQAIGLPLFLWPRGNRRLWRITSESPFRLSHGKRWPSLDGPGSDPYDPLSQPHLFEEFAEVGRLAHAVGRESQAVRWETEMSGGGQHVHVYEGDTDARRAATAANDPKVRAALLAFVKKAGAPYAPRSQNYLPLEPILMDAYELFEGLRITGRLLESLETKDEVKRLDALFTENLAGVRFMSFGGRAATTCENLLAALWLQLYEARASGRAPRFCKGCGRLFIQRRSDQEFHEPGCRNRFYVRLNAEKTKGGAS